MNNISNSIYSYYLQNWDTLPFDKQFHFASRLYLWNQDEAMAERLTVLRATFSHNDKPQDALQQIIANAKASPIHGSKNAAELRRPYFQRYPNLKMYVSVLFRIHFMQAIYGIDAKLMMHSIFGKQALSKLKDDLLADSEALAILSTHAINFLYLYDRVINEDDINLSPDRFLSIGRETYDFSDKLHLQLFVYLYTHCIIGESRFYCRSLPEQHLPVYSTMLEELEQVINDHYDDINLDNKCEFLVCAKIVGQPSRLASKIFDEATRSISPDGTYLIDTHNNNPQIDNVTLDKSEHRNVLYIMANRDFLPLNR